MQTPKSLSVQSNAASASIGSWVKYTSIMYYKSDSKASLAMDMVNKDSRKLWGLVIDQTSIDTGMVNILQLVAVESGDIDPEHHLYVTTFKANSGAETQGKSSPRALCLVLKDTMISIPQIICNFYEEWQSQVDFDSAEDMFMIRKYERYRSEEMRNEQQKEWEAQRRILAKQHRRQRRRAQKEMSIRMFMAVLRELKARTPEA